ncbi:MAG: hypothetical protein AAFN80_13395 [Pseudomonadota bacterium]
MTDKPEEELATVDQLAEARVSVPEPDKTAHAEAAQFRHTEKMQEAELG